MSEASGGTWETAPRETTGVATRGWVMHFLGTGHGRLGAVGSVTTQTVSVVGACLRRPWSDRPAVPDCNPALDRPIHA